ncbi:SDR family NAD(P)-dependent oxidoreductase [Paenibacillus hunanensis]|uniref:SDR family oxidoreductase n=1 Tax=Paenibacillus hunanensis TaxID=539262 RepID=UPI00202679E5|nr:SDR family oxidoreductase [Paenibacillus hunanensis]MCL9660020.1 SDR family NAD(P)-dependent oxidoreductase [Paenibacillus hunanensis]
MHESEDNKQSSADIVSNATQPSIISDPSVAPSSAANSKPLAGKVALVAGATRGAGRGIAAMLGEAGATVYCTGRTTSAQRSDLNRPETIEQTAAFVEHYGGKGIAVQVDHTDEQQVKRLFQQIAAEQDGQLDIVVNDIWGGEKLTEWGVPFWQHSLPNGLLMQDRVYRTHLITSHYAAPLLVARGTGLIIEVTDGTDYRYRGNLYYSLAKIAPIHMATAMAEELKVHGVAAIAVTPGFLRSEEMLEYYRVNESNWQDAIHGDRPHAEHFRESETPFFVGRAIAALASDCDYMAKSGQALSSWELSDEYDIVDIDGRRPHWGRYAAAHGLG